MTKAEALLRLERMLGGSTPPALSPEELGDLLDGAAVTDSAGRSILNYPTWAPSTAYALDDFVVPSLVTGRLYRVTVAGTSDASEPTWPSSGSIVSGSATFELDTATIPGAWSPTYDLAAAAAQGWRDKAGLVSDRFRFSDGGDAYERQQIFEHCLRMGDLYEAKASSGGIIIGDASGSSSTGLGTFTLPGGRTRPVLPDDRLITLAQWNGSGPIPAINGPTGEVV